MPNRIIKESIWTSPNLNKCSLPAQGFFLRLLPLPDDHGCFDARPQVLKGRLYPLLDVKPGQIEKWLQELASQGLVRLWENNCVSYGYLLTWDKHQRIRSLHTRKTPEPPQEIFNVKSSAVICRQLSADDGPNPNPNPNPNPKKIYGVFHNVLLADQEYGKLAERFGKDDASAKIETLSRYIASKGDKYKSHYATILNWAEKDKKATHSDEDFHPFPVEP